MAASSSAQVKSKESASPDLSESAEKERLPERLIVCLDGTWNKRDSGTNIYHLSNLVQDGEVPGQDEPKKTWLQRVYYDEGVGTGILDGVTGGAFGIGLSANVREAYDWLVEKYYEGDEIYVFGFSRGAFTARSLVGLIAKCGLLRRGAPLPPDELWEAYRVLGRHGNARTGSKPALNWWERIAGRPEARFRSLWQLQRDWGESDSHQPEPPRNEAERLLVRWSRRVPIKCLGIFDTVGAMGIDSLAIPWLRQKTAQFHDTELSSLILNGFHALAIDEHRANFHHIPWHAPPGPRENLPGLEKRTIKQRWFIGAHSNIGGSYDDGLLAQYPLAWMMAECKRLGLVFRPNGVDADPSQPPPLDAAIPLAHVRKMEGENVPRQPHLRDSFRELAKGIWSGIIRAKRDYRRIRPLREFRNGVLVRAADESLDDSVLKLLALDQQRPDAAKRSYNPANLWRHRPRNLQKPPHRYEGREKPVWLLAWLVLVGAAAAGAVHLFHGDARIYLVVPATMLVAGLLDFFESALNHAAALEPDGLRAERRKAIVTFCLFLRLLCLCAIVTGLLYWLFQVRWWLVRLDLTGRVWWLLALDFALFYCTATATWCAAPMKEAGFGSIVQLQRRRSPDAILQQLLTWARTDNARLGGSRQLLMPVAHTLWRDMLGYIPAYASALFFIRWLYLHLWEHRSFHWLSPEQTATIAPHFPFWSALAILILCAADYLEDIIHLHCLARYPRRPAGVIVLAGTVATGTKFFFLFAALLFSGWSFGWLIFDQGRQLFFGNTGLISVAAIVLAMILILTAVSPLIASLRKKLAGGASPVSPP